MESIASDVFIQRDEQAWEPAGEGLRRQVLGYDEDLMLVCVEFEEGAVGEPHSHAHSQVTYVESGAFEVTVAGATSVLRAGDGFYIPPHAEHGAVALEAGCLIDVFAPARQDILDSWNGHSDGRNGNA